MITIKNVVTALRKLHKEKNKEVENFGKTIAAFVKQFVRVGQTADDLLPDVMFGLVGSAVTQEDLSKLEALYDQLGSKGGETAYFFVTLYSAMDYFVKEGEGKVINEHKEDLEKKAAKDSFPKNFKITDFSKLLDVTDPFIEAECKKLFEFIYKEKKSAASDLNLKEEQRSEKIISAQETVMKKLFSENYNEGQRARILAHLMFPRTLSKYITTDGELNDIYMGSGGFYSYLLEKMTTTQWSSFLNSDYINPRIVSVFLKVKISMLASLCRKDEVQNFARSLLQFDLQEKRKGGIIFFNSLVSPLEVPKKKKNVPNEDENKKAIERKKVEVKVQGYKNAATILLDPALAQNIKQTCFNSLNLRHAFWVYQQVRQQDPELAHTLAGWKAWGFKQIMPAKTYEESLKHQQQFSGLRQWFQSGYTEFDKKITENGNDFKRQKNIFATLGWMDAKRVLQQLPPPLAEALRVGKKPEEKVRQEAPLVTSKNEKKIIQEVPQEIQEKQKQEVLKSETGVAPKIPESKKTETLKSEPQETTITNIKIKVKPKPIRYPIHSLSVEQRSTLTAICAANGWRAEHTSSLSAIYDASEAKIAELEPWGIHMPFRGGTYQDLADVAVKLAETYKPKDIFSLEPADMLPAMRQVFKDTFSKANLTILDNNTKENPPKETETDAEHIHPHH